MKNNMAVYNEARDLINIGAYKSGSSPEIDAAIALNGDITAFLRQSIDEGVRFGEVMQRLESLG